jgi:hypothetical protein
MKHDWHQPPREFSPYPGITLRDAGDLWLDAGEQVTLRCPSGAGNDITRKDWGYYLTNSINANLRDQGFKTALVASGAADPRLYLMLVERGQQPAFESYLAEYGMRLVAWLDEWRGGKLATRE